MSEEEFSDIGGVDIVKKEKKSPRKTDDDNNLNINSLMDIMTILLVFLLVSITTDPLNIKMDDYMQPAKSQADSKPVDSIPITITKQHIIVDHKPIVRVDCITQSGQECQEGVDYKTPGNTYRIDKSFKEDGQESSFLIEPLYKKLDEMVKLQKELKAQGVEISNPSTVTLVLDHDIPFRMIAELVHTSGMAGLSDLRFAIIKRGTRY